MTETTASTKEYDVWTTSSTSHGLSSNVKIHATLDVEQDQILEKAKKEWSRNMQDELRHKTPSEIDALNKAGVWNINASRYHGRKDMSLSRAMEKVIESADTVSPEKLDELITALNAKRDGHKDTETN